MSKTRRVLLMMLVLALLMHPLDILLAAMLPDVSVDPAPQCIAGMLVSTLLLGVPAWLLRPWTSARLTKTKAVWPGLMMAAAAAVLSRAALTPVDAAWQNWLSLSPDAMPVPGSVPVAMLYIAALAVIPAIMEEAFFRGAVLTGLLDGSRRVTAVLLTAGLFALMHGNAANLPSLLAVSLLLTLLMLRTGHIAVPMAAHLVYNLTALNWIAIPVWGSLLCGAVLLALSAYICVRQPKVAHPPMKWADGLIAAASVAVLAILYFI